MGINLGSSEIGDVKLGSSQVDAVYVGSELIWPLGGGIDLIDFSVFLDATGNFSHNISGMTFAAGDIGILTIAESTGSLGWTISGWTLLGQEATANGHHVFVRTMDGTETTVASTGYGGGDTITQVTIWRGCAEPTASNLTVIRVTTSAPPDPPVVPITVAAEDVVLASGSQENGAGTLTFPTLSAGYTVIDSRHYNSDIAFGSCWKTAAAPSEDPGPFTSTGGSFMNDYKASTLVLKAA